MKKLTIQDVTPETIFYQRRKIITALGLGIAASALPKVSMAETQRHLQSLQFKPDPNKGLELTPENKVIGYNNFYEFGVDKSAPAKMRQTSKPILGHWKLAEKLKIRLA